MVDIEHFKRINDGFGHPVGDRAIKAVAETLRQIAARPRLLARFGGEEFVLTLPQTDIEAAAIVAERMRLAIERLELDSEAGPVRFTVSIGIATYRSGVPLDAVIESADQALYRAKQGGRNRVELAISGSGGRTRRWVNSLSFDAAIGCAQYALSTMRDPETIDGCGVARDRLADDVRRPLPVRL
ncbi:MAG: GGDEF domain-containing protein [Pseudomonadota bacterium]